MYTLPYRNDIDAWKGFAILAVVLYHLGILKTGYLGVDLFLVINGYLIIPSLTAKINERCFSYFGFLKKRLLRLAPLVIIASSVCLAVGYSGMLPDDYENLSETAVASNFFSQNILASITTKDYWKSSNAFSPLMHMWFVGILIEFYVAFPLILLALRKVTHSLDRKKTNLLLTFISAISFALFINPDVPVGNRFYLLPYRLFEFTLGGLIGCNMASITTKVAQARVLRILQSAGTIALVGTIVLSLTHIHSDSLGLELSIIGAESPAPFSSETARNLLIFFTSLFASIAISHNYSNSRLAVSHFGKILEIIGKASLSIFVWHQVIIAFYRYFVSPELSVTFFAYFITTLTLLTFASFRYVEKLKFNIKSIAALIALFSSSTAFALFVYLHAGVMRDVPELDVSKNNLQRNMFALYCDRVYEYDKDFPADGKPNILIVNTSFARDFANMLLESTYKDSANISYAAEWNKNLLPRVRKSDIIFSFGFKSEVPQYVFENLNPTAKIMGIGTKSFGFTNGNIYAKRNSPGYFEQTLPLYRELEQANRQMKQSWNGDYIDLVALSLDSNGRIRIFTPEHKFISQDCNHFTQNGAKHFASLIDWPKLLGR
jgi:peptidoglycan/LPS O-acetylase OafA/YrhL